MKVNHKIKKKVNKINKESGIKKWLIYESLLESSIGLKPSLDLSKWLNT